jgi:hypothetical protein
MIIAGLMTGALCTVPAASFAYGPGGGGNETPPGFGPTLAACTDNPGQGCSASGDWHKCHLKVTVPAQSFVRKVDVVISKIKNKAANKHLTAPHSSICAFGVGFFHNGQPVHVVPGGPAVKLLFTGDPIQADDLLFELIPGGSVQHNATVATHQITATTRHTLELAVVNP